MENLHTQRTQTHTHSFIVCEMADDYMYVMCIRLRKRCPHIHSTHTICSVKPSMCRERESESESESDKVCGTHNIKNANVELLDEGPLPNEQKQQRQQQ